MQAPRLQGRGRNPEQRELEGQGAAATTTTTAAARQLPPPCPQGAWPARTSAQTALTAPHQGCRNDV